MRLSWPRQGDKRRAITVDSQPLATSQSQGTNLFFINTTWRDIRLHRYLSSQMQPLHPVPPLSVWKLPQLREDNMDLVHYCKFGTVPY